MSPAARDRVFGYAMATPGLAAMLAVILFPVLFTIVTSTFAFTLLNPRHDQFVGLANYAAALASAEFRHALLVTLGFVVAVVLLEFLIGFTVALMLNAVERFKSVYYAILLFPLLINPVVVGLIWRMFLHPCARHRELPPLVGRHRRRSNWLGDPRHAFWTVVLRRHLAPGLVHDRAAAGRPLRPAARAL